MNSPNAYRHWLRLITWLTVPLCLWSFAVTLSDLKTTPGLDLRAKVVGARRLAEGLDPYILDAHTRTEEYLKTYSPAFTTPAVLSLYRPLMRAPWATQRAFYFCFDWSCAAATIFLILRYLADSRESRYLCWSVFAVFLLCSYSFRAHLERGQYYMLLLALTCHTACALKQRWTSWHSCVPTALLLLLRPTYGLLLLVAFVCLRERRWSLRVLSVSALMLVALLPVTGIRSWQQMGQALHERQDFLLSFALAPCGAQPGGPLNPPLLGTIEGADFSHILSGVSVNATLTGLAPHNHLPRSLLCRYGSIPRFDALNSGLLALTFVAGVGVMLYARRRQVDRNLVLAFLVLWPLITEFMTPERYIYGEVTEALPLLLMLLAAEAPQLPIGSKQRRLFFWVTLVVAIVPTALYWVHSIRLRLETSLTVALMIALPVFLMAVCIAWMRTSTTAAEC